MASSDRQKQLETFMRETGKFEAQIASLNAATATTLANPTPAQSLKESKQEEAGQELEAFLQAVKEQISSGSKRRDEANLRDIFQKYSPVDGKISKKSLLQALSSQELYVSMAKSERLDEFIPEFYLDRDGQIDFDEFKKAVMRPSPIESWSKQVPLWHALADAIPRGAEEDQPLRAVANLTDAQIDVICAELVQSIRMVLRNEASQLRAAFAAMDTKAKDKDDSQSKFSTFKASVGSIEDFHRGLRGRVGTL